MSACSVRCSVVTESGRIATLVDEALGHHVAARLEHAATTFPGDLPVAEHVAALHVCSLCTLARMDSGALYWWYVL
jgi:E3 ubiquitin-protein ligase EDD1